LRYGGRGGNDALALTLVEQAAACAANADPHTRGETLRRLAEQRALDGDEPGFRAALEGAYHQFARVDGSKTGFIAQAFMDPWLLHATAGMGLMALNRGGKALRELRATVRDPATLPRVAADMHADMARVWVQLEEPEQACAELTIALTGAIPVGHRMGLARIRGVRASFRPEWSNLDCVREFDEQFHLALLKTAVRAS
jgi:hypothetical protein